MLGFSGLRSKILCCFLTSFIFQGTEEEIYALESDGERDVQGGGGEEEYMVLMCVLKHFVSHVKEIDAIIPPCRLIGGATEIVETCVRFQIERVFRKLRTGTIELLTNSHYQVNHLRQNSRGQSYTQGGTGGSSNNSSQSVQPAAQEAARTFTDMMQQVLRQMEPLAQTGASILREMSRLFSDLVQTQFYHFLKWFNASLLTYTEGKRAFAPSSSETGGDQEESLNDSDGGDDDVALSWLEPTPPFLLFLAFMCQELASEGIGECIQVLIECLPANAVSVQSPTTMATHAHGDGSARTASGKQLDVAHMVEVTRETYVELLQHVVKHYGNQLCAIIKKGMEATSWTDMDDEPRSVQEMVAAVIEATFRHGKEIALALGDEQSGFVGGFNSRTASRDFRRRTNGLKSRGGAAGDSGMQLDIERIFAKRIQIFQPVTELNTEWFAQGMLKMAIKAFGELVRMQELSKFALQQVQVNAEFLRSTTVHLVMESQELESLLSDLLSNARERSLEDVLMEQSSVVAIVSTKSTQVLSRKA